MSTKSETLRTMQAAFGAFLTENEDAIRRYHSEVEGSRETLDLSDINLRNTEWTGEELVVSLTDRDGDNVSYSIPFTYFDDPEKFIEEDKRKKAEHAAKAERVQKINRVKMAKDAVAQAQRNLEKMQAELDPQDAHRV